ncbi:MAG: hypothetical protein SCH70_14455 [Candidatus Methanoperedens sp.]|nr:hypothetical protein [Candidatus Methanoperedens sp.]
MRTISKILIGLGIVVLIVLVAKYFYIIGFLLGSAEPLRFSVHNSDINKHRVTVEIFYSDNKSLFKETYEVNPKEDILSPKITEERGEYTFKVTLDDMIEKTYKAEVGVGGGRVSIWLYNENISGSKDPIYITQVVV